MHINYKNDFEPFTATELMVSYFSLEVKQKHTVSNISYVKDFDYFGYRMIRDIYG